MKLRILTTLAALATAGSLSAATGIFGSYINVTSSLISGGSPVWYDAQVPGGSRASDPTNFNGYNFGSYGPGSSLSLTGAEVLTYKNGGSDVTGANVLFRIYPTGSPSGSFTSIPISWTADAPFSDASGTNFTNFGDQKWANGVGTTNLLTGLSNGNYTLEVYLTSSTSDGTMFSNNGGSNYAATFTVVPEPSGALLGLLGAGILLRRRRI